MTKIPSSHIAWAKTYIHTQNPDDDACGDIIPLVYTCKDCFFFKNDICHNTTEKRYTSKENPSCRDFEYKEIKVEL